MLGQVVFASPLPVNVRDLFTQSALNTNPLLPPQPKPPTVNVSGITHKPRADEPLLPASSKTPYDSEGAVLSALGLGSLLGIQGPTFTGDDGDLGVVEKPADGSDGLGDSDVDHTNGVEDPNSSLLVTATAWLLPTEGHLMPPKYHPWVHLEAYKYRKWFAVLDTACIAYIDVEY